MAIPERSVYPTQPRALREVVTGALRDAPPASVEGTVHALIVPDTNLSHHRDISAAVYRYVEDRTYDTVILVAPSHEGSFRRLTICSVDTYRTPLGEVPVDDRVRHELCDEDDDIFIDDSGHFHTEGVDVQLPFLQHLMTEPFSIVPVVMGNEDPALCRELGSAIGEVMYNRRTLVVASVDIRTAAAGAMDDLAKHLRAGAVSELFTLVNGDRMELEGKGALMVALIASLHRRGNWQEIIARRAPGDGYPGAIGAVLGRQ
jgi:AmmeMemoRadiSam system protein B